MERSREGGREGAYRADLDSHLSEGLVHLVFGLGGGELRGEGRGQVFLLLFLLLHPDLLLGLVHVHRVLCSKGGREGGREEGVV